MVISKLHVHMDEHEFCERALELLRKKVPSFVNIHTVTIDDDEVCVGGQVDKVGSHAFTVTFRMALASDGSAILLKLLSADVSNTFLPSAGDFALVNMALVNSIPDSAGISYSWSDETLSIEPSTLFAGFGIDFTARASCIDFGDGIDLDFTC